MTTHDSSHAGRPPEGGYGSPTPEDEMPASATGIAQDADHTAGPGAGESGGTQDQPDAENAAENGPPTTAGRDDEAPGDEESNAEPPVEAPSTEAEPDAGNAGPTRHERESFSSESDADASGQ